MDKTKSGVESGKGGVDGWVRVRVVGGKCRQLYLNNNKKCICTLMFIAILFTIANIWKHPKCPWVDINMGSQFQNKQTNKQKTMVHLHNGILPSIKKEGAPTLPDSMNEHYVKWNKPGCERQIPYDLIYKRNLINKIKQWAKYNQRHRSMEQTDSGQRGGARGIMVESRGIN